MNLIVVVVSTTKRSSKQKRHLFCKFVSNRYKHYVSLSSNANTLRSYFVIMFQQFLVNVDFVKLKDKKFINTVAKLTGWKQ